uniref:receptor-type tyrosine-protein phosphatase V-like n=1 Tax=Myxine glutinosa TaxID=7769 RepID=UPI00358EA513
MSLRPGVFEERKGVILLFCVTVYTTMRMEKINKTRELSEEVKHKIVTIMDIFKATSPSPETLMFLCPPYAMCLECVHGLMISGDYQGILERNVQPSVRKLAMSPDLNPIEYLWGDLKTAVGRRHPSKSGETGAVCTTRVGQHAKRLLANSSFSAIHVDLIVGLTVFFLLAAIIIATGGFLIKKCRIKKQDEITRDFSLRCQNLPISLSQFDDHYHNLEANSELGFSEEFAKLQDVGRCEIISVARLPENRERNRYTNILPYDVTRVILSSEVGKSDYINASFIPGKSSPREYIASQDPMMGTLVDFWRMVWELGVSNIIMLTKFVENGKVVKATSAGCMTEPHIQACMKHLYSTPNVKYINTVSTI